MNVDRDGDGTTRGPSPSDAPDYLYDARGAPDPDVARLEALLAPFGAARTERVEPSSAPRRSEPRAITARPPRRKRLLAAAAIAAALAIAAWRGGSATATRTDRGGGAAPERREVPERGAALAVETTAGAPAIDARAVAAGDRLAPGSTLVTGDGDRARVTLDGVGRVDVAPGSSLRLVTSTAAERRFALDRGEISALTWAPPRLLFIETPSAVAVDLGCAFTVRVDDDGRGLLSVTSGYVAFERDGRESWVPRGASCATRKDHGPGTPRFDDASEVFRAALDRFDVADGADDALATVLAEARVRDVLTLWHLLPRVDGDRRRRVLDRAAALDPPPEGVADADLLALRREALLAWRASLSFR